ncbi:hypothetical protein ANCDUO_25578, partial [Ancylostoma duodenale]
MQNKCPDERQEFHAPMLQLSCAKGRLSTETPIHRSILSSGFGGGPPSDSNQVDTSETVYISSLALLKMLKHGRAGVPME